MNFESSYSDNREFFSEYGLETIFQDSNDDEISYFQETLSCLKESDRLSSVVQMTYENLDNTMSIVQSIHDERGVQFSQESAIKTKIFKKIVAIIQNAFKKLIQAVLNFLKNLSNAFKSSQLRTQSDWYLKNKDAVLSGFKMSPKKQIETQFLNKEKMLIATDGKVDIGTSIQLFNQYVDFIKNYFQETQMDTLQKINEFVNQYQDAVDSAQNDQTRFKIKEFISRLRVEKAMFLSMINRKIYDEIYPTRHFDYTDKHKSPQKAINIMIYGSPDKPVKQKYFVNEFFVEEEFDHLDVRSAQTIRGLKATVKTLAQHFKDASQGVKKTLMQVDRNILVLENKNEYLDILDASREIYDLMNQLQSLKSANLTLATYLYSEYLKYRSLLFQAAAICAGEAQKKQ